MSNGYVKDAIRYPVDFSGDNLFLPQGITLNPRQRRKIIGSFANPDLMWARDVSIPEKDMDAFVKEVAGKLLTITAKQTIEKKFRELISNISGNILKLKCFPMFEKMKNDKHLTGILAYFTRDSLYRREEVQPIDILEFLRKYPDPCTFQYDAKDFLDMIGLFNPPEKRNIYETSMQTFMTLLYGKQFEYLMQINLIKREAREVYLKKLYQYKEDLETLSIGLLDDTEAKEILKETVVQGSPFKGLSLTPEILAVNGLQPKYKMSMRGFEMAYFSAAYNIGQGRLAVMNYMKKDGKYIPRSYYFSNSHAIWRYLDGYTLLEGKIVSYGSGEKRGSTNLPLVFQKALAEVTRDPEAIVTLENQEINEFIFAGTTRSTLCLAAENSTTETAEHNETVPQKLRGNFYRENEDDERIPAKEMKFYDPQQVPDSSKLITGWESRNNLYGKITYEAFLSRDDQLIYIFCRDETGRVWLAGIENHTMIRPTGLKQTWVDGGDLTTPAYEYIEKAGKYGNPDLRWGNYIDMFKNYLSKVWIEHKE